MTISKAIVMKMKNMLTQAKLNVLVKDSSLRKNVVEILELRLKNNFGVEDIVCVAPYTNRFANRKQITLADYAM